LICDFCGQGGATVINEDLRLSCPRCTSLFNTCAMCAQAAFCDFETNPIDLPKQVQKVVRQGNMTFQSVVPNENRIRETCLKNCSCYDPDFGCLKQNGTCSKYKER